MQKSTGNFLIFLCIAMIFLAGCTNIKVTTLTPVATPTPQIVVVTILVTPVPQVTEESPSGTPEVTEPPPMGREAKMDEAFLAYISDNQIIEGMKDLMTASAGIYNISSGYNAEPKMKAVTLTDIIVKAPTPGTQNMMEFRSAMMNALSVMDGSTAGFSRYQEAMQTVFNAQNAACIEMPSSESFTMDTMYFKGNGATVQSFNITETGPRVFTIRHSGYRNFAVILKDGRGKFKSLLVNEIGSYIGKKSETLNSGTYYLDITADGAWSIDIT